MRLRLCSILLIISALMFVCGCGGSGSEGGSGSDPAGSAPVGSVTERQGVTKEQTAAVPAEASIGVIYSSEAGSSVIQWVNDEMEPVGTMDLSYSDLGRNIGFQNACYQGADAVMVSQGESEKDNSVLILSSDGTLKTIRQDRINPVSWSVSDGSIAVASNFNWECFIDLIDLQSGAIRSVRVPDDAFADTICFGERSVYGISEDLDDESGRHALTEYSMEDGSAKKLLDLPPEDSPAFLQYHSGKLYLISGGSLLVYDTADGSTDTYSLTRDDAFNLIISDDALWIGYTDIHADDARSLIECRDPETGEVLCSAEVEDVILQIGPDGQNVCVLGENMLYRFTRSGDALTGNGRMACSDSNKYTGGFFLLDQGGTEDE